MIKHFSNYNKADVRSRHHFGLKHGFSVTEFPRGFMENVQLIFRRDARFNFGQATIIRRNTTQRSREMLVKPYRSRDFLLLSLIAAPLEPLWKKFLHNPR